MQLGTDLQIQSSNALLTLLSEPTSLACRRAVELCEELPEFISDDPLPEQETATNPLKKNFDDSAKPDAEEPPIGNRHPTPHPDEQLIKDISAVVEKLAAHSRSIVSPPVDAPDELRTKTQWLSTTLCLHEMQASFFTEMIRGIHSAFQDLPAYDMSECLENAERFNALFKKFNMDAHQLKKLGDAVDSHPDTSLLTKAPAGARHIGIMAMVIATVATLLKLRDSAQQAFDKMQPAFLGRHGFIETHANLVDRYNELFDLFKQQLQQTSGDAEQFSTNRNYIIALQYKAKYDKSLIYSRIYRKATNNMLDAGKISNKSNQNILIKAQEDMMKDLDEVLETIKLLKNNSSNGSYYQASQRRIIVERLAISAVKLKLQSVEHSKSPQSGQPSQPVVKRTVPPTRTRTATNRKRS